MKWLLIGVLALTVSISGCNKTGYECPTCEGEVAPGALLCVHCGQGFDFFGARPVALDPKVEKRQQEIRDAMNGKNPQNRHVGDRGDVIEQNDMPIRLDAAAEPKKVEEKRAARAAKDKEVGIRMAADKAAAEKAAAEKAAAEKAAADKAAADKAAAKKAALEALFKKGD